MGSINGLAATGQSRLLASSTDGGLYTVKLEATAGGETDVAERVIYVPGVWTFRDKNRPEVVDAIHAIAGSKRGSHLSLSLARLDARFLPPFLALFAIAAEWQRPDLDASLALVESGALSLSNLITHHQSVRAAAPAYRAAFGDPDCLKMVLDWRCGDT